MIGWVALGVLKWVLAIAGIVIVPIAYFAGVNMKTLWIWGNWEGVEPDWNTGHLRRLWWYIGRNSVHNLTKIRTPTFTTYGGIDESEPGFQWRYRHSTWLDSFRIVWGEPGPKGKDEFYIGWKMDILKVTGFSFFQLRPFWLILIPISVYLGIRAI